MPTGETTVASTQAKLYHDVCEPAQTEEMVLQQQHNSLLSGGKFADTNYITVLTTNEVLIYDNKDTHISVSSRQILNGWRDTIKGLWRVPLQPIVPPPKYEFTSHNNTREDAIANVYELPSDKKYTISPRLCRFPNQEIMDQGQQEWQLCYMAHSHFWVREPTIPRIK